MSELDQAWLARWTQRLRDEYPTTVAILLAGSHARCAAGPHSDVDLRVLQSEGEWGYRALFETRPDGALRHVSVEITTLAEWQAESDEPARWSLGLPTELVEKLVWATPDVAALIGPMSVKRPPAGEPELEDFLEAANKVKNALHAGDSLALRWAAKAQARLAPRLIYDLNPAVRARTRTDAVRLALDLPVAPDGYRADMLVCLGLDAVGRSDAEVADASARLARGIWRLLRERAPDAIADPDLHSALVSGTLERYFEQRAPAA